MSICASIIGGVVGGAVGILCKPRTVFIFVAICVIILFIVYSLKSDAAPPVVILQDKVAVTYCGGEWTADRVYHWPCVIFRDGLDGRRLPHK